MRLAKHEVAVERTFLFPDDPDKAKVTIRLLTEGQKFNISDKSTEYEMGSGDGVEDAAATMKFKVLKERRMKAVACIVGWENVYSDEKGKKELQCNDQNKRRVIDTVPGFLKFVMEKYDELEAEQQKKEKAEGKNSESSPGGTSA